MPADAHLLALGVGRGEHVGDLASGAHLEHTVARASRERIELLGDVGGGDDELADEALKIVEQRALVLDERVEPGVAQVDRPLQTADERLRPTGELVEAVAQGAQVQVDLGLVDLRRVDGGRSRPTASCPRPRCRVGVIVDELSAPALVLGLRARGDGFTARTLQIHADAREPCRLSTRQLLRERLDWFVHRHVFVCENPAVLASAAGLVGAPIVCIEGQPATAARLVLQQLAAAGAALHYHGDFDWAGLTIANFVMREHGAHPWRMSAADYLAADDTKGVELRGAPVAASWDPGLADAMKARGFAVHEEQVIGALLVDIVEEVRCDDESQNPGS